MAPTVTLTAILDLRPPIAFYNRIYLENIVEQPSSPFQQKLSMTLPGKHPLPLLPYLSLSKFRLLYPKKMTSKVEIVLALEN